MKNKVLYTLLFALYPLLLIAQEPDTLWTRKHGGIWSDVGNSVLQTSDQGYIVAGITLSFGPIEVYLIKTDFCGNLQWERTYHEGLHCVANSINTTMDGGYIIVGEISYVPNGPHDIYLVKVDSMGYREWTKMLGGLDYEDGGIHIVQTTDGGYIIGGFTSSGAGGGDAYVVRTDSIGDTLWTKTYGSPNRESGLGFQKTLDNCYIITGDTGPWYYSDIYLLKIDSIGDTVWVKTYGGAGFDYAFSAEPTADSGYIIGGTTDSYGAGQRDFWLIKTNSRGDTIWTRTYGGPETEECHSIKQTNDGGYIVAGWTHSGPQSVYLIRTDSLGSMLWTKTITGERAAGAYEVQQTSDLGYIVGGFYQYTSTYYDVYLVRIAPDTLGIDEGSRTSVAGDQFGATIFNGPLLLPEGKDCRVFDITGRVVEPDKIKPGIYFLEIDGVITRKVIKIR